MVRQAWFLAVNSWLRGWPRQRLEVPLPLLQGANHTSISVVPIELVVIQCFIFSERRRHLPHPVLPDARHHRHPHLPPRAPGWTPFRFQNPLIIPLLSALLSSRHLIRLISLIKLSRSDDICYCWFLLIRLVNILRWDLQWFTNTSPPFSRFSTISSWTINSFDHLLVFSSSGAWVRQHICRELCRTLLQYGADQYFQYFLFF